MPDEYDAVRRNLTNHERGLYFELGRAHMRGETPEKGWVKQFRIETGHRSRVIDNARTDGRGVEARERKSGRLPERETREQLLKERAALESGQITRSVWETVEGEKIPRSVADDMRAMARDFKDRFEHQVISRADAARAIELGRSLVARQGELVRAYELERADRARKRLQNIREIVRKRELERQKQQERADRLRRAQERLPKVREAAERLRQSQERKRRERVEGEAAERVAREFGDIMKGIKREERAAREAREAREARAIAELNALSGYAEQVQQAREAADAADQARQQEAAKAEERARQEGEREERERKQRERDAADAQTRARLPPDVADLLIKSRPTPGLEHLHRQPPAPGKTRGGRDERVRMRAERGRGGREHR
ncbi:hypothetical protein [Nocardia veterana]|uniref:Uncharacterized protein n=1 Tax=Nocardia veterana TaxID=132249 RepID=A0A7X6LYZ4_9NOCA|nr:hypothetical protein [Nocardia veterana]NKY87204.1 hypothetical protein [Nocardia veterana]